MQLLNKRIMLPILAVLLIVRFILVPIFTWQQEQIEQIDAKSQRLNKSSNVIARIPLIKESLGQLKLKNNQLQKIYYNHASLNGLKLQLQQQIETLFTQHNIKVKNFTWVAEISGDLIQERARISYEGTTKDFARLQLAIARLPKLLNVVQWTMNIRGMKELSLGKVVGRIVLTAYNVSPIAEKANVKG